VNQTTIQNQKLFDLHLEYKERATARDNDYQDLQSRFRRVCGYLPIPIEDDIFVELTEKQQEQCRAFWTNRRVIDARRERDQARILENAYFNAYADCK
jgi:hypothetical protein